MYKGNGLKLMALIVAASFVLTACSTSQDNADSSSSQSSVMESAPVPDGQESSTASESESSEVPSTASSNIPASSAPVAGTVITITPVVPGGLLDSITVTDSEMQEKIKNYLSAIVPVESPENPIMGGTFFNITISEDGVITEEYELSNRDNTPNGHYRISKDNESFSVEPALWDIITPLFPSIQS